MSGISGNWKLSKETDNGKFAEIRLTCSQIATLGSSVVINPVFYTEQVSYLYLGKYQQNFFIWGKMWPSHSPHCGI